MIGLDTNVVVRYLMQDDALQSPKANALVESLTAENPGFVTLVSVVEIGWVLSSCFNLSRAQTAQALDAMLRTRQLRVEQSDLVRQALRIFGKDKADLADCLIACSATQAGCHKTMTFDVAASKHAGMTLINQAR
jgi:predicted nucleic-acid-binding protein